MSKAELKKKRVFGALSHDPFDTVPIGEFFWSDFVQQAALEAGIDGFDPYRFWDLDLIVITPNMDPRIEPVKVLEQNENVTVVKTGFGATVELRRNSPMPRFVDFEIKTLRQLENFVFDPPEDERRYFHAIDDQINSVVDTLYANIPSFIERVKNYKEDFCIFGSVCEPWEFVWRLVGSPTALLMSAEDPSRFAGCIERIGDFLAGITKAQIKAAEGALSGLYIWGDVAYDQGMFFSPSYWREVFKEQVARICETARKEGIKVIYHGCGNARAIFEDLIEIGIDAYNPLEAKAGLDVIELKRFFGNRWSFNGNIDIRVLETNESSAVEAEVLRKLNAAKGGGYILQSDHSVSTKVKPETYDRLVSLARKKGRYPLDLGSYDLPLES